MLGAGVVLRKRDVLSAHDADDNQPAGKRRRGLHGIREAGADVRVNDQAVHHNLEGVLPVFFQVDVLRKVIQDAVGAHARKAAAARGVQLFPVGALPPAHDRGKDQEPGALRHRQNPVDNLVHRLLADFPAADRAVRDADARIQQAQVIVNFGDRAHRGARVLGRGLLVDGNRRGKPVDGIDVRLLRLPEELAGVGGERLHIPAPALGVDGVERERGFTGT